MAVRPAPAGAAVLRGRHRPRTVVGTDGGAGGGMARAHLPVPRWRSGLPSIPMDVSPGDAAAVRPVPSGSAPDPLGAADHCALVAGGGLLLRLPQLSASAALAALAAAGGDHPDAAVGERHQCGDHLHCQGSHQCPDCQGWRCLLSQSLGVRGLLRGGAAHSQPAVLFHAETWTVLA